MQLSPIPPPPPRLPTEIRALQFLATRDRPVTVGYVLRGINADREESPEVRRFFTELARRKWMQIGRQQVGQKSQLTFILPDDVKAAGIGELNRWFVQHQRITQRSLENLPVFDPSTVPPPVPAEPRVLDALAASNEQLTFSTIMLATETSQIRGTYVEVSSETE